MTCGFFCSESLAEDFVDPDDLDALIDDEDDTDEFGGGRMDELLMKMEHGRYYFRRSAILSAKKHSGSKKLTEKLIELVRKKPPEIASISAVVLGEMKTKTAVPVLMAALKDKSEWVRESAAYALGLIGDKSALSDLVNRQPKTQGLSRWIYQDAVERIKGGKGATNPHRSTLKGASVYFFGAQGPILRDSWRNIISKFDLKVDGVPPHDLNEVLLKYGGPPDASQFYRLLEDRDGQPQVDVVIVSNMLAYEFVWSLRWRLFQFVRRGGSLIVLGNGVFVSGKVNTTEGRTVHHFAMPYQLWHSCLPQKLDSEFQPSIAGISGGFRKSLRSGIRKFEHGRSLLLASDPQQELPITALDRPQDHMDHRDRSWYHLKLQEQNFSNMLLQAVEGEKAFGALIDLYRGPETVVAGKEAAFHINLFSAAGDAGSLMMKILLEEKVVAEKLLPVDFRGGKLLSFKTAIPLPWTLRDGEYTAKFIFKSSAGVSEAEWKFGITSPLRFTWKFNTYFETAGGKLSGQATIRNLRNETISNLTLALDVLDGKERTLQRFEHQVTLKPGANGPFPLRLHARDYRVGSYSLILKILQDDEVLQESQRLLHRVGVYDFRQDLVYVPWNTAALPSDPRMRKLLTDSGFNGVWSLKAYPGWYNWGTHIGPLARATPTWPGEFVEQTSFGYGRDSHAFARHLRYSLPGFTILDPWDESEIETVASARGEDMGPIASVLYRNWLKSRYFSLDALNKVWRKEYGLFHNTKPDWFRWRMPPKSRIPPPLPWDGDLTSWNQIWSWRGAEKDWRHYEGKLWGELIFNECWRRVKKLDPNHPWHGSEAFHSRLYIGARPSRMQWESHYPRGKHGNTPSTIMLHFYYIYKDKRAEVVRRNHWDALAAGARHFITWSPDLNKAQGLEADTSIWNADYTLRPHGVAHAETIRRVRSKEQVLLDARNSHSKAVAFLYHGSWPEQAHGASPQPLFDAILFGGILPESLRTDSVRSERIPLDSFKVIFLFSRKDLPHDWQERLGTWQKNGGVLLKPEDYPFKYQGDRIESPGFTKFQTKLLSELRKHGVVPPVQVVDDNNLPEPSVEPALLETDDRSQFYLLAAPDWSLEHSQAFGDLLKHEFSEKVELKEALAGGAKFSVSGKAEQYHLWAKVKADQPFASVVTIDGKPGQPLTVYLKRRSLLQAERGLGKSRWIAGPRFKLSEGEHELKIRPETGSAEIEAVWIVNDLLVQPKLVCNLPNVKQVYDVYNDRFLSAIEGGWRMALRASYGEVYSLITESLGPVEVEPRLEESDTGRRLQLKIQIRRTDGSFSECRHALNIRLLDAVGRQIDGMSSKTSIRGWKFVTLYPAREDPPLPWNVEVKDLTSGRVGNASVTKLHPEPFESLKPVAPVVLRAEPLPWLDGDVHVVPFRVSATNNGEELVKGTVKIELPRKILLEGQSELNFELGAGKTKTFQWVGVLGREQAIALMDRPPRIWLHLEDGETLQTRLNDLYILRWEKTPPLVMNLRAAEVSVKVQNFLKQPLEASLQVGASKEWRIIDHAGPFRLPAGQVDNPATTPVKFRARLQSFADRPPEVYRMPLLLRVGDREFECGHDLIEVEKRRQWMVAPPPLEVVEEFEPEIPEKPLNAVRSKLWNLEWKPFESDTLIDFPADVGKRVFGVTNVCFAADSEVRVRLRGREKVEVWLAGTRMITGKPMKDETEAESALELQAQKSMKATARRWMPLVVRYQRQTAYPLSDLVFLDSEGKVIWTVEFRASPELKD